MKVLLVKPREPSHAQQKLCVMPPIGLFSIAMTIQGTGCAVCVCDEHLGEDVETCMDRVRPDIVGISCQYSIQHFEMKRIAHMAKERGCTVVAGGFHAYAVPRISDVDHVINGAGEIKMANFLGVEPHVGLVPCDARVLEPYWDADLPHDLQSKTKRWASFLTSRGCDNRCSFCGVQDFWGKWRPETCMSIEHQLSFLKGEGIEELFIEDDNISYGIQRFIFLIKLFKDLELWWSTPNGISARDITDMKVLDALNGSSCWRLSLAFETGSPKTAKLMRLGNKWLPYYTAQALVNKLKSIGIKTCGFFIIGYPGETEGDVNMTLEYANALNLDQRNIYIATPYPGTGLYKECANKGYFTTKDDEELYEKLRYTEGLINTPWLDAKRVEEIRANDRASAIKRKTQNV